MNGAVLMVQGTASSVGKSVLVTALCRILRQDGLRVAPFKAQNMSNNSYVTSTGGEIGRAQVNQAEAAGIEPETDMNPILLKPEGDARSQVVVRGKVWRRLSAREYHAAKAELLGVVAESLARLRAAYDVVVIEGAGSPAEINLRASDIVNMAVARLADAPVLLVADIDRGGVFAALLGTLQLLEPDERARVRGLLINRFRGDAALLAPGLRELEARAGCPVLGVVPYLPALHLPEEDSQALDAAPPLPAPLPPPVGEGAGVGGIDIAVLRLPRIANFDDFGPLAAEPGVRLRYVERPAALGVPDLVVLPGSKSTLADLAWLRASGLGPAVLRLAAAGVPVLGICGGFQLLGRRLCDPDGLDGAPGEAAGLGLLAVETVFRGQKTTRPVTGRVVARGDGVFGALHGQLFSGYEIHVGRTTSALAPFAVLAGGFTLSPNPSPTGGGRGTGRGAASHGEATDAEKSGTPQEWDQSEEQSGWSGRDGGEMPDGAVAPDGLVAGTYVHGLFHNDGLRRALLGALAARRGLVLPAATGPLADPFDRLADAVAASVELRRLYALCGLPV